jgi:hypothetical protein
MNVKTAAAIVGTLSLGTLVSGCATVRPPAMATTEKGGEFACDAPAPALAQSRGGENSCAKAAPAAASTPEQSVAGSAVSQPK